IKFMQSFIVIKESADQTALKLVDNRFVTERGALKEGYQSISGWMKKSNLLLSRRCLKTRNAKLPGFENGIFNKKALVLNIVSENTSNYEPPKYFSNPGCTNVIDTALIYQINFVFKETETAYLLAEDELINPDDIKKMKGWVLKEKTTPWNHNLAFEANWDKPAVTERKQKEVRAKIFERPEDVERYYIQNLPSGYGHIPYDEVNPTTNRPYGEVDRFPALNYTSGNNKWKLGVVGSLIGPNGEKIPKEIFDELKHVIDSVSINIRKVNVVFVIDATSSILPYKDYIISAVMNTLDDLNRREKKTFKFGAALYRDAPEEAKAFQAYSELVTKDQIGKLTNWIGANMVPANNRCDTDLPESVFYGVKKAINHYALKTGQSNFIILIGDCGNHNRTKYMGQSASGGCASTQKDEFTNISTEDLSSLMAKNDINMLAFQVHHEQDSSYTNFVSQIGGLYIQTAKNRFNDSISNTHLWQTEPSFFMLDTNL
ncbi:MAG: VWA domain-containing protein, partial [Bacteroidales bacterium]|nr:VWA domain-containing protein [Bacteroidales bacterium]